MPITLPNFDDRRFDDLVTEARALIPSLAPEWTDHNPSDPGITLIEMFAYLSEILIYRLNRVTDANTHAFLQLLNGSAAAWQPSKNLDADIRDTIQALRRPDRAVTPADFEFLAKAASTDVARAACVPRRNLDRSDPHNRNPDADAPGHVSVVVLPVAGASGDPRGDVARYLETRRLLTTRLHVVAPREVAIGVRLTLWLESDALASDVVPRAKAALKTFLHPLTGGVNGQGWPFGRPVFVSEIYRLLDTLPGVDYVEPSAGKEELIVSDPQRRITAASTTNPEQLVGVSLAADEILVVNETLYPLDLTTATRRRN
jgi:hypothetical protein